MLYICCSHCLAKNRVPPERFSEQPKCGQCHQQLLNQPPIALNESNFNQFMTRTDLPVVVDFWAAWCNPCQMMAPHFSHAASQLNQVQFAKVNTEQAQQLATQFNIRSLPTLILFKHGKEIARQAGAHTSTHLQQWLHAHL